MSYLLFILPFITIFNQKDKVKGFVNIFSLYSLYVLLITVFLQYFHLFDKINVYLCVISYSLTSVIYFFLNKKYYKFDYQYSTIIIFLISLLFLFLPNIKDLNNIYLYPFYSDEWVNYGLSRFAVLNNVLPIYNYLDSGSFFINLLLPFNSFVSFFLIYFDVNMSTYVILGKILNLIIMFTFFVFIRKLGIRREISLIAVISMLFITNTANITGLWHFIPLNLAFLFFMLSFMGYFHLNSILSILFYPPIGIVIAFNYFLRFRFKIYKYAFLLLSIFGLFYYFNINNYLYSITHKIYDLLIRPSSYFLLEKVNIFDMIPLIIIPFVFYGMYRFIYLKNSQYKHIFYIIIYLSIFWIYYTYDNDIIIMDKVRFVTITSWLLIIPFALALNHIYDYLCDKYKLDLKLSKLKIKNNHLIILIIIFLSLNIKSYPYIFDNKNAGFWGFNRELIKISYPINNYVNDRDIYIFNNYVKDGAVFLSTPWKSLVLTSLTHGVPLHSKSSYLSVFKYSYSTFLSLSCDSKYDISKYFRLKYFYGAEIKCDRFKLIQVSDIDPNNKMYLYEFR